MTRIAEVLVDHVQHVRRKFEPRSVTCTGSTWLCSTNHTIVEQWKGSRSWSNENSHQIRLEDGCQVISTTSKLVTEHFNKDQPFIILMVWRWRSCRCGSLLEKATSGYLDPVDRCIMILDSRLPSKAERWRCVRRLFIKHASWAGRRVLQQAKILTLWPDIRRGNFRVISVRS